MIVDRPWCQKDHLKNRHHDYHYHPHYQMYHHQVAFDDRWWTLMSKILFMTLAMVNLFGDHHPHHHHKAGPLPARPSVRLALRLRIWSNDFSWHKHTSSWYIYIIIILTSSLSSQSFLWSICRTFIIKSKYESTKTIGYRWPSSCVHPCAIPIIIAIIISNIIKHIITNIITNIIPNIIKHIITKNKRPTVGPVHVYTPVSLDDASVTLNLRKVKSISKVIVIIAENVWRNRIV